MIVTVVAVEILRIDDSSKVRIPVTPIERNVGQEVNGCESSSSRLSLHEFCHSLLILCS